MSVISRTHLWKPVSRGLFFRPAMRSLVGAAPLGVAGSAGNHDDAAVMAAIRSDPKLAERALMNLPAETRKKVGMAWAIIALEDEFTKADLNKDGHPTFEEFSRWGKELVSSGPSSSSAEATQTQLFHHFLRCTVPFVGFGMVHNGLMVITGEAIDSTLGVMLGITTMAAAALGNALSNGLGMGVHGAIERAAKSIGIPDPRLTLAQMHSPKVQMIKTVGGIFGVLVGCILGMAPLLFMNKERPETPPAARTSPAASSE
mmetsp:Transcript_1013/g.2881  ORF Transcript_1013/g.2881 Transcript_1013/m.2881 type:complete len:259 (-) Transcript_1013:60-836(-)